MFKVNAINYRNLNYFWTTSEFNKKENPDLKYCFMIDEMLFILNIVNYVKLMINQ